MHTVLSDAAALGAANLPCCRDHVLDGRRVIPYLLGVIHVRYIAERVIYLAGGRRAMLVKMEILLAKFDEVARFMLSKTSGRHMADYSTFIEICRDLPRLAIYGRIAPDVAHVHV